MIVFVTFVLGLLLEEQRTKNNDFYLIFKTYKRKYRKSKSNAEG